jgi:O-antigen ligase
VAIELIAFAIHPSADGVTTVLRLVTTLGIIVTVAGLARPADRAILSGALALIAIAQLAIALAEIQRGGSLGLAILGESPSMYAGGRNGQLVSPEGTLTHPHILASLAVLAAVVIGAHAIGSRRPVPWAIAEALAIVPAGITYARTALAGVVLAAVVLARGAIARRPGYRAVLVALVVGFGVPAVIGLDGWGRKTDDIAFANGRDQLTGQALTLIAAEPLTGVGPGRQLAALQELRARTPEQVPLLVEVHSVPLAVGVEAGVGGLAIVTLLLVVAGYRAYRGGLAALAVYIGYLPFVLLDHFPYSFQSGLVLTAIWLGTIERLNAVSASTMSAGEDRAARPHDRPLHVPGRPGGDPA